MLEESIEKLKLDIKDINDEIKEKTGDLQTQLSEKQKELEKLNRELKEEKKNIMNDKSKHIIERFKIWLDSKDKKCSEWIMDDCPLRNKLFDDEYRYQTIEVPDRICDYLCNLAWHYRDNGVDDGIFISYNEVTIDENINIFETLPDEVKEELTEILENAIELNLKEFVYDW